MSYYDQAVMMQLKLGSWDTDPSRKEHRPTRRGDHKRETQPMLTRFFSF